MSMFNEDQESYMQSLRALPDNQRCWCGWYTAGNCSNKCEEEPYKGLTLADRHARQCDECKKYPMFPDSKHFFHGKDCSKFPKIRNTLA